MSRAGRRARGTAGPSALWPAGCMLGCVLAAVLLVFLGGTALALLLAFVHALHPGLPLWGGHVLPKG